MWSPVYLVLYLTQKSDFILLNSCLRLLYLVEVEQTIDEHKKWNFWVNKRHISWTSHLTNFTNFKFDEINLKPRIQCKRQFPRFAKPMWCIAIIYHKMKPQGWLGNALRGRNSRAYLLAPAAHCGETGLLRVTLWKFSNNDKIFFEKFPVIFS